MCQSMSLSTTSGPSSDSADQALCPPVLTPNCTCHSRHYKSSTGTTILHNLSAIYSRRTALPPRCHPRASVQPPRQTHREATVDMVSATTPCPAQPAPTAPAAASPTPRWRSRRQWHASRPVAASALAFVAVKPAFAYMVPLAPATTPRRGSQRRRHRPSSRRKPRARSVPRLQHQRRREDAGVQRHFAGGDDRALARH